jgi:hypothetical protein
MLIIENNIIVHGINMAYGSTDSMKEFPSQ